MFTSRSVCGLALLKTTCSCRTNDDLMVRTLRRDGYTYFPYVISTALGLVINSMIFDANLTWLMMTFCALESVIDSTNSQMLNSFSIGRNEELQCSVSSKHILGCLVLRVQWWNWYTIYFDSTNIQIYKKAVSSKCQHHFTPSSWPYALTEKKAWLLWGNTS